VTLQGGLSTRPGSANTLRASGDLADAVGLLDLHLDPSQSYRGDLSFELYALPEGKRGELSISVSPASETTEVGVTRPLHATFPDDDCGAWEGFPVAADLPLAAFGGQSAAGIVAARNEALAALDIRGVWSDCSPSGVRFELGTPTRVCSRSPSVTTRALLSPASTRVLALGSRRSRAPASTMTPTPSPSGATCACRGPNARSPVTAMSLAIVRPSTGLGGRRSRHGALDGVT
jgi:hypothetical protein